MTPLQSAVEAQPPLNWKAHKYPFNIGLMGQYDENMSKRYYIASNSRVIAQHIEEGDIQTIMAALGCSMGVE